MKIEEVLDIAARRKRSLNARKNKVKLKRGREIAQRKLAPEDKIKTRAYALARKMIRTRYAGTRGNDYNNLSVSEKIAIDKMIEGKEQAIKKLALRLIPRVKKAEYQRLQSFVSGKKLPDPHGDNGGVKENLLINIMFEEMFKKTKKEEAPSAKSKAAGNDYIKILNRFDTKTSNALTKKANDSNLTVETLSKVYARGLKSWTEETQKSPEQFAFSRVNSFINKGKNYFEEDADLVLELSKDTKPYTHDVSIVGANGELVTRRKTIHANSKQEAMIKSKEKAKENHKMGGHIHKTFAVKEQINEAVDPEFLKKHFETVNRYGPGNYHSLTHKQRVDKNLTGGIVVGHDPKKEGNVRLRAEVNTNQYKEYSVPEKHLTPEYQDGWAWKERMRDEKRKTKNEELVQEISQETLDRYRIQNTMDKSISKVTLKHDLKSKASGNGNGFVNSEINRNKNILRKRNAGTNMLNRRMSEENISELSHGLLKKYSKMADGHKESDELTPTIADNRKDSNKMRKFVNRTVGKQRADDKVTNSRFVKVFAKTMDEARQPHPAIKAASANLSDLANGGFKRKKAEAEAKKLSNEEKKAKIDKHKEGMMYHSKMYKHHEVMKKDFEILEDDCMNGRHSNYGLQAHEARGAAEEASYQSDKQHMAMMKHRKEHDFHRDRLSLLTNREHKGLIKEGYEENLANFEKNADKIQKDHNRKSDYHFDKAKEYSNKATLNGGIKDLVNLNKARDHRIACRAHSDAAGAIVMRHHSAFYKSDAANKLSSSLKESINESFPKPPSERTLKLRREKEHQNNISTHPKGSIRYINYHDRAVKVKVIDHHLTKYRAFVEVKAHKDELGLNPDSTVWTKNAHLHDSKDKAIKDKKPGYHPDNLPIINRAMKEENISELSKNTLTSYINKTGNKLIKHGVDLAHSKDDLEKRFEAGAKISKTRISLKRATDRLKEETDLSEISKELRNRWLDGTRKNYLRHYDDKTKEVVGPRKSNAMSKPKEKMFIKQQSNMWKDQEQKNKEEHAKKISSQTPKVHDLRHMSHGDVYDHTQTSDKIKDGDVLHVRGGTAALVGAWPTMIHGKSKVLHSFKDGTTIHNIDNGIYHKTGKLADKVHGIKEEVTTADKEPVVVQSHKDQYGNTIPAKTVMRKTQKKIIKSGNVHDGGRN